jgi:hypothetical protein
LPFLIVVTYLFLVVDVLKGPNSLAKHIYIDSRLMIAITMSSMLFIKFKKTKLMGLILKINSILLLPFWALYLYIVYLDVTNYQNYVLATYYLHPDGLITIPFFSLFLMFAAKFRSYFPKFSLPRRFF